MADIRFRSFSLILEIGTEEMTAFVSILRTNFTSLMPDKKVRVELTHWARVTHICVGKLTIIGSDNGLSPGRRQAIICTNGGILLIRPLGTNFSEILIGIQTFSFKKMHLRKRGWGSEWVCGWIGDRMCDCINLCSERVWCEFKTVSECVWVVSGIGWGVWVCGKWACWITYKWEIELMCK